MRQDDFEKLMAEWAAKRSRRPRHMAPSDEMYRAAREMAARRIVQPSRARWVLVGAAAACVAVVAGVLLLRGPEGPRGPLGSVALDAVAQREGFLPHPRVGHGDEGPGPGMKRGKKGPGAVGEGFLKLQVQIERRGESEVTTVDALSADLRAVRLSPGENYRVVLVPAADRFIYIFQLTSDGLLARLLPNETYCPARNPLAGGETYYVPAQPKWLYLGGTPGTDRIYVVSSSVPKERLLALYSGYVTAADLRTARRELEDLLRLLEGIVEGRETGASAWRIEVARG
jgi:hypothetical protein